MNGDSIRRIVAEIEYRHARRIHWSQSLPRLVAVYANQHSDTRSVNGLVIERVYFVVKTKKPSVSLGMKGLALIDVLVRYKLSSLSAAQIERILRNDPICRRLGTRRLMNRRVIKVHIHRLRSQLARALDKEGVAIEPKRLLVSESTELANVKVYRLAMQCEVVHRSLDASGNIETSRGS
jgi:DNA-binding response OmpR family regulator